MPPIRVQPKSVNVLYPTEPGVLTAAAGEPQPDRVVTVLAISPLEDDHRSLRNIFAHSRWSLYQAHSCEEAVQVLRDNRIAVIITERELKECNWKEVLAQVSSLPPPLPRVVVASRQADDDLWSEALNLGAYNVLAKPFDGEEVFWVVSHAWLEWKSELERLFHPAPLALGATA